jgi:hypothetical protein
MKEEMEQLMNSDIQLEIVSLIINLLNNVNNEIKKTLIPYLDDHFRDNPKDLINIITSLCAMFSASHLKGLFKCSNQNNEFKNFIISTFIEKFEIMINLDEFKKHNPDVFNNIN